ncbi:MAG: hypothetical protein C4318_00540 [Acidimicrobiia bacterium]
MQSCEDTFSSSPSRDRRLQRGVPMKVAIAGCGSAGKRHFLNSISMGHTTILFDPDTQRAKALALEAGAGRSIVASKLQALWEERPDAFVIASPTDSHAQLVGEALERRIPVLVEKPLALSYSEGVALTRLQSEARVPLMVGYNLRFLDEIAEIKQRLDNGEVGRPLGVALWFGYDLRKWRKGVHFKSTYSASKARGGGVLLEASHEIDLAFWLLGPFDTAFGFVKRTGVLNADPDDLAVAVLETRSGAVISLFLEMISATYRRGFEIVGEKGTLGWKWSETGRSKQAIENSYRTELAFFLKCVQDGRDPTPDILDGLYVLGAVEAIARSSTLREPTKVPPPATKGEESRS